MLILNPDYLFIWSTSFPEAFYLGNIIGRETLDPLTIKVCSWIKINCKICKSGFQVKIFIFSCLIKHQHHISYFCGCMHCRKKRYKHIQVCPICKDVSLPLSFCLPLLPPSLFLSPKLHHHNPFFPKRPAGKVQVIGYSLA